MRDSRALQTVACFAIVGSAAAIAFCSGGWFGPGIDRGSHEATGTVIAEQALALLKPGGHLIVIARDSAAFKNPAADIQFSSFRREIARHGTSIASIHSLQVDPLRPLEVPAGDFFELLRKTVSGDVIVSFMGPPLLSEDQLGRLGARRAGVVAFCPGSMPEHVDLRALFEQGLLQTAVVAKRDRPKPITRSGSLRERFDQSFLVVTASNAEALSATP